MLCNIMIKVNGLVLVLRADAMFVLNIYCKRYTWNIELDYFNIFY